MVAILEECMEVSVGGFGINVVGGTSDKDSAERLDKVRSYVGSVKGGLEGGPVTVGPGVDATHKANCSRY